MDEVAAWIGVGIGGAALLLAIPVLVLTAMQQRRDTERSMVEWIARETVPGVILLRNQGLDTAHDVTAEAWDAHDIATVTAKEFGRDRERELVLGHRKQHGPDDPGVTRIPRPRVPDEPPMPFLVPGEDPTAPDDPGLMKMRGSWAQAKAMQEISEQTYAEQERAMVTAQVQARVTWRSKRGRWHSELLSLS